MPTLIIVCITVLIFVYLLNLYYTNKHQRDMEFAREMVEKGYEQENGHFGVYYKKIKGNKNEQN